MSRESPPDGLGAMHKTLPLIDSLNPPQREAVRATEGPVLVVAGPGTGKTRTLTIRLAYLMTERRVPPDALLAVTFTTRAAREMGERLEQQAGAAARRLCLGTFHGLCLQWLRAEARRLDLPGDFGVCDRRDQLTILEHSLKQSGRPAHRGGAQQILKDLSRARNQALDPHPWLAQQSLGEVYDAYQRRLRRQGLLDFDDLLALAVRLLESFPEVRQGLQERYRYLSVDEYQDVNPLQYRLLRLLAGQRANLWAVGDADQAIYAFRGAEVENFLRFERDFPGARVIRLEQAYRSTPQIVAAATQVIAHNPTRLPFTLSTDNPAGPAVRVVSLPDEEAEADWVVRAIEEHVGGTSHYRHYQGSVQDTVGQRQKGFRDFAALFRLNALARPLEEALARSGIPYRVIGGTRFFDRKVIKDCLAYLRAVRQPDDGISLSRILNTPPRGLGTKTQAALEVQAEQQESPLYRVLEAPQNLSASQSEAIREFVRLLQALRDGLAGRPLSQFVAWLLEATNLGPWRIEQDARHENDFLMLRALAAQYDDLPTAEALDRFLAEAALAVESDEYDAGTDAVTLMTLHAAKGLEFTEVFLCGVEEGILPYNDADLEEERRLFYVGLTRARERVHLLSCRNRFLFGERHEHQASRFLSEFDDTLKETTTVPDRPRQTKDPEETQQFSLL